MSTATIGEPRGVLRAEPAQGAFTHERRAPEAGLGRFVEHFWTVSWRGLREPTVREVLAHPSVHVVLERGGSGVAGVPRGRFARRLEGTGRVFGIKFRPGCFRPFVTFPVSRITGRVLSLDEVFGESARALEDAVLGRDASEAAMDVMDATDATDVMDAMVTTAAGYLRERLPPRDSRAEEAAAIVKHILGDRALLRVEDVARTAGSSPRALQRLFREYVGVSPKWVIRRYRLHEAVERVHAGTAVDWPALALELGYADQAHFIHDFKTLIGRTPAEYGRRAG